MKHEGMCRKHLIACLALGKLNIWEVLLLLLLGTPKCWPPTTFLLILPQPIAHLPGRKRIEWSTKIVIGMYGRHYNRQGCPRQGCNQWMGMRLGGSVHVSDPDPCHIHHWGNSTLCLQQCLQPKRWALSPWISISSLSELQEASRTCGLIIPM